MSNVEPESAQTPGASERVLSISRNKLAFNKDTLKEEAVLRNQTDRPLRLRLEVLGGPMGVFTLPPEIQEVTLQRGDSVSVPVHFAPRKEGVVMTASAIHNGGIHVWDLDADRIVNAIDLSGVGVGCVLSENLSCMAQSPQDVLPRGDGPSVDVSIMPELARPGDKVRATYSVTGATEVRLLWGHPSLEILEGEDSATDWPAYGGSELSPPSGTIEFEFERTTSLEVVAYYADGYTSRQAVAWMLYEFDYGAHLHKAQTPLGGVYRGFLDSLPNYLRDIENLLEGGAIRDNTALDKFNDPYLKGGMTRDILNYMHVGRGQFTIFSSPQQYPSAIRAKGQGRLCKQGVYGEYFRDLPGVAICAKLKADALTLLHELCHYAMYWKGHATDWPPYEECKAATAAQMCFGHPPPGYFMYAENPDEEPKPYKCEGSCRELHV